MPDASCSGSCILLYFHEYAGGKTGRSLRACQSCTSIFEFVPSFIDSIFYFRQAYVPTLVRNWGVYIPTQVINFSLVPPHLRFVFVSVVSLFWSTSTSCICDMSYTYALSYLHHILRYISELFERDCPTSGSEQIQKGCKRCWESS